MDSMMTSPNGMHIDHVITQNHVTSPQHHHSIPDQIQILQKRLAQLQMNQEALLHPGLNYVYNPLIAAYSLHPNVAPGQDIQNSNGHVNKTSPNNNYDQMEAIISRNSHIPYIDDPSSESSAQNESESNQSNNCENTMDTFPSQRGHIVKLPKPKKGSKHKNSKTMKNLHFSNVIKNSNAEELNDQDEDVWSKRRQSKKELLSDLQVHSMKSTENGNGALQLTDYYSQMRDTSKYPRMPSIEHVGMPYRVPTSERLSFCVPVTPDSEGELADKLEGLSTNSSFTSQLSPQTNGTARNSSLENLGHVIVNIGTSPCPSWDSNVNSNKENCDSTEKSQLLPKDLDGHTQSYSQYMNVPKSSTVKVMASSEYVHRNTSVSKKQLRPQQRNVMSLDLVSHVQVTSSPNLQKPITSVKPLPKNLSSPQSPKVLPLKSPRQPVVRARIIQRPGSPYSEMADSTV